MTDDSARSHDEVVLADARDAAAAAVQAAPDELKWEVAAAAVQAAPDELKRGVAAAAVQAAPDELKSEVAAAAVRAAPDKLKRDVAAAAVQAAPDDELRRDARAEAKRAAAGAVQAAPDELKLDITAAVVQAAPDEFKRDVAAGAVQAAPDELKSEVASEAVHAAVTSRDFGIDDVREAVNESIRSSLAEALHRPVVRNVEGSLRVSGRLRSTRQLELSVAISTGAAAWQAAAADPTAARFRLTGGEDQPTAPFEVVVDAPGLYVSERQTSIDLPTSRGEYQWEVSIAGGESEASEAPAWDEIPIWITVYSSGKYLQAIRMPIGPGTQDDGHEQQLGP